VETTFFLSPFKYSTTNVTSKIPGRSSTGVSFSFCLYGKPVLIVNSEHSLEYYVKRHIKRRLKNTHETDLGSSPFYNDIFFKR
jgi:hypothetical protein